MKRIVIKVGSNSITKNFQLDFDALEKLTTEIAGLIRHGHEVVLVSSGAVATGIGKLAWKKDKITLPQKQAAAAVGQGALMHRYEQFFKSEGITVAQILLTNDDIGNRKRYINAKNTFNALLQAGIVPIVNENDTVVVDEIRFGDNDRLAALVTGIIEADLLILLTDVDGLYDDNPKDNPQAKKLHLIEKTTPAIEEFAKGPGSKAGTGGMITKIEAAKIATLSGATAVIAKADEPKVIKQIVDNEGQIGSRFLPVATTMRQRKQWLSVASKAQGKVSIDDGAINAISKGNKSLLLAGVRAIEGSFCADSVVDIVNLEGTLVGKGIAGVASGEILLSLHNITDPQGIIVVHKDDLTII